MTKYLHSFIIIDKGKSHIYFCDGGCVMIFQVLCMDINEQVKSKKISSLILSMESNDIIWSEPIIKETNQLHYADNKLVVDFSNFDTTSIAVGSRFIPAYIITVKSTEYSLIEPIRMRIIDHLKEIHFSHIRILKDEVSEYIACEMYPYFYRVENKLREFIVNSLVEKIGANFFQYTVTKEIIDKVNGLKRNEPHFIGSDKVIGDVMLLYFDALGRIVYGDFSIFTQPKDILRKVDSATSLDDLKRELLDGTFQKYFKDCFEKKDFEVKWIKLNALRNKVAHSSYFLNSELEETKTIYSELEQIIDNAYSTISSLKLSLSDKENLIKAIDENTLQESKDAHSNVGLKASEIGTSAEQVSIDKYEEKKDTDSMQYKSIGDAELLKKLAEVSTKMDFVGLRYFVTEILGKEGYSYNASYTVINYLADKGVVLIEKIDNPYGNFETTSIKINQK